MGSKRVEVIHGEGTAEEQRLSVEAHIQPKAGFFAIDTPVYEGDVVEVPDPRGGTERRSVAAVKIHDLGSETMRHIEVTWGEEPAARVAGVRRLGIEGLHDRRVRDGMTVSRWSACLTSGASVPIRAIRGRGHR